MAALAAIGATALGLGFAPAVPAGAAPVRSAVAASASQRPINPTTHLPAGVTPKVQPGPRRASAPAGAHLTYYGGHVISNVQVIQVLYGTGSYTSEVSDPSTTDGASISSYYTGVTNSTYFDWLSEYNTTVSGGTQQTIGRGSFVRQITISPAAANNGATVDDTNIQAELHNQIAAGHLPAPSANTLYALYFRAGQTITQGGSASGVQFCAYHGTVAATAPVGEFYYSVLPDFTTGGMTSGCGNGTRFQNETSVSSHEMIEAVTDAEVGLATTSAPPLAWYDNTNGEIGDICNGQQQAINAGDGHSYTVQQEFSNLQNNCVVSGPATTNDFSISTSPTSASVAAGSQATTTVATAVTAGSAGSVSLSASGLPSGVTASFSPTSVSAGGSSTLTLSTTASAAAGTYSITVTGVEGSKTHTASFSLTVTAAATNDFSIALSPTSASVAAGSATSATVSTAVSAGSAATVSLSVSGTPSGATASVSPTSVTAGGSSTLSVTTSASTPAGTYNITVTGTEGSATHSATFALTVTAGSGGGLTNGGFESGNLSGWTSAGTTAVVSSGAQGGTYAARVGSTGPSTDSSLAQTFTVPTNGTAVTFWYNVTCPDTVTYDWATATLKDNTTGVTTTPLAKTCVNPSSGWKQVSAAATAGHSVTLTLSSHDDNYPGDPTYTLYDSVNVTSSVPSNDFSISVAPTSGTVTAGSSASATVSTAVTSGSAATVSLATSGAPSGVTASVSPSSVTAGSSSTLSLSTASTTTAGTYSITVTGTEGAATHSATFKLTVNPVVSGGGITNGGFETGTLSGWSPAGASSTVVTTAHTGSYSDREGNTTPTNGDSTIVQTFTAPTGATHLGVWYKMTCPDTVTYDWATVTLKDNTTGTTATILGKTCTTNAWTSLTGNVTAGHSYTLTLLSHDDNYSSDPSFTQYDDVTLS